MQESHLVCAIYLQVGLHELRVCICHFQKEARRVFFFQFLDPVDLVGSKYEMDGQVL